MNADRRVCEFGFRVDQAFFPGFLHSNADRFSSIAPYIPLDRAASRPRRSLQKVGTTISVTSVHEFFPTTVHIAWINERVQEKGEGRRVGGGRDGEGVVANTHAPNGECKVVGGVDSERREKGRDERGSAKGREAKQGKRRRLSGREV